MKTNFKCKILAHSINPVGQEVITYEHTHELSIHADYLTHRWARNGSSGRAIPYERMKEWILSDPALPLWLGINQPGMQSGHEVSNPETCEFLIKEMFFEVYKRCDYLKESFDLHKETINKFVEPWGWINVVTTTGKDQLFNAFNLRCSEYARPAIQRLFVTMARLYRDSVPMPLDEGEWHLPYIDKTFKLPIEDKLIWSTAFCAWVSKKTVDGKIPSFAKAKTRHDDCIRLLHVSPLEHQWQARADNRKTGVVPGYDSYRSKIAGEFAKDFDFSILDTKYKHVDFLVP